MKKLVTIIMACVIITSLSACGETKNTTKENSDITSYTVENSTTEKGKNKKIQLTTMKKTLQ